ncbi:hypothetical protein ACH427_32280, partial [Streptomyces sp. NPDC020379]|uniref:hypothetical protein n=1 Tax=Streptomyces sp. NPDC020379 TaxID=3365071 RepID=UPI00378FC316
MPAIFHVDQARTFKLVMFLSCSPKMAFGTQQQDKTKDGLPKWEVQVVAGFDQFGRVENEVLKIGVASHTDPAQPLGGMPQPVELVGFRVGVSPVETKKDKNGNDVVRGGTAWY